MQQHLFPHIYTHKSVHAGRSTSSWMLNKLTHGFKWSKSIKHCTRSSTERECTIGTYSWLLVAGCWLMVAGCWLLAAGCWSLFAGCWLLAAGCRLLFAGWWLLVALCCLSASTHAICHPQSGGLAGCVCVLLFVSRCDSMCGVLHVVRLYGYVCFVCSMHVFLVCCDVWFVQMCDSCFHASVFVRVHSNVATLLCLQIC